MSLKNVKNVSLDIPGVSERLNQHLISIQKFIISLSLFYHFYLHKHLHPFDLLSSMKIDTFWNETSMKQVTESFFLKLLKDPQPVPIRL